MVSYANLCGPNGTILFASPNDYELIGPNTIEGFITELLMVAVNSSVRSYSSPSSVSAEISVGHDMIPCSMFFAGLGGTDTVDLQMFVGTDTDDSGTEALWVTLRSNGADVQFSADDNQYVIESPGFYRFKSTATLTGTTSAASGILHSR